ncbi:MAG: RimK/LysX family protein, partial [Planctomycetota bacterium]|nr:RimK/LysX family protein [Planctomycetota bacterium]
KIDEHRVHFEIVRNVDDATRNVPIETDIVRESRVRPSSGVLQTRFVVAATIVLGGVEKRIEVSLVSRRHMICRMLLGRAALDGAFLVDPSRTFLLSRRPRPGGRGTAS